MGGSGRVWRVCNFMTQTQPNPQSLKNRPNQAGRVWWVGGFSAHPYFPLTKLFKTYYEKLIFEAILQILDID